MSDFYKKLYDALVDELEERYGAGFTLNLMYASEERIKSKEEE